MNTVQAPRKYTLISRIVSADDAQMDEDLPMWARRSNPIVKRELGEFWKRMFPNVSLLTRVILVQMLLILIMPLTFLMTLILPIAVVSVVLLPVIVFLYVRALITVIYTAASSIVKAQTQHTLDLLRVSTVPLNHIVLGKIAASIWHSIHDLDLVLLALSVASLPMLSMLHFSGLRLEEVTLLTRLGVDLSLMALMLRIALEPFMFGAVAVMMGAAFPTRAAPVIGTLAFAIFYYVMVLVPLAAPFGWWVKLLVEVVLPIAVPVIVSAAAVWTTHWLIERQ